MAVTYGRQNKLIPLAKNCLWRLLREVLNG
jgi:hypothetical protein